MLCVWNGKQATSETDPHIWSLFKSFLPFIGSNWKVKLFGNQKKTQFCRCPRSFQDTRVPVSNGRETEQQGAEKSNQFFLELLPDSSPDVICFLSCLWLCQNQQV